MTDRNSKEFRFGNEKFGGSYRPGDFELKFPDELSRDEFEEMFRERIESLHKLGREFMPFDDEETKSKREKLKPLSIRVKAHTKEFFKNNSILSAREVLELYENFNNGSEAFINSLLEDEKNLEQELSEIQEKLHNAKLFKDKLNNLNVKVNKKSDEEIISSLSEEFEGSQIKEIIKTEDLISDIELYNTQKVILNDCETIQIVAVNDVIPVVYYFSYTMSEEDTVKILAEIKKYCKDKEIEFVEDDGE
ncbi:MAG: hypothetical protein IJH63_14755 [Methanobrevibacter sp.]|uniref:Uncharacterized protein n=1 Tax=Methanobrevibacter millerae TaxID=230361 RepID=A0A8T3V8Q8_9EURY|nr:hypothetical protein [Methanobrevibacter millerae]MBE6504448.1 hypothetical protein [Methanobrevibacter millerae]MBR0371950.1 hypothetical protein [Methanobrevibacter sp.]